MTTLLTKNTAYGFLFGSLLSFLSLNLAEGLGESGLSRAQTRGEYAAVIWLLAAAGVIIAVDHYRRHRARLGNADHR